MKKIFLNSFLSLGALFAVSCVNQDTQVSTEDGLKNNTRQIVYVADFGPLNSQITGLTTGGQARFVINGNDVTITVQINHAPKNMVHWQHLHGFLNNQVAVRAEMNNDVNGDGILDVTEIGEVSGVTMIPLNDNPVGLDMNNVSYPTADSMGNYRYVVKFKLSDLQASFANRFYGSDLFLNRRVIYIHGVPQDTPLPLTVASIGDIPAQKTLPIACGKIEKVIVN